MKQRPTVVLSLYSAVTVLTIKKRWLLSRCTSSSSSSSSSSTAKVRGSERGAIEHVKDVNDKLHVLGRDGYTAMAYSALLSRFEQGDQESFRGPLQSFDSLDLKTEIGFNIMSYFANLSVSDCQYMVLTTREKLSLRIKRSVVL